MVDTPKRPEDDVPKETPRREKHEEPTDTSLRPEPDFQAGLEAKMQQKDELDLRHGRAPEAKSDETPEKVGVVHTFRPPKGDEATPPRAEPGREYPAFQDDNLGRNARKDLLAVREGDDPPHRSGTDVQQFRDLDARLDRETGTAEPPTGDLYQGGRESEAQVQGYKEKILAGEVPVREMDVRSTTTDPITAMTYAEATRDDEIGASQDLGYPARPDGEVAPFQIEPGEDPLSRRVDPSEPTPYRELLVDPEHLNFDRELADERDKAAGDPGRLAVLDRLENTVRGTDVDGDGNAIPSTLRADGTFPESAHTDGLRRDALDEQILQGRYELTAMLDTRDGKQFEYGDVSRFLVPKPDGSLGLPKDAVFLEWQPARGTTRTDTPRPPTTPFDDSQGPLIRRDSLTRRTVDAGADPSAAPVLDAAGKVVESIVDGLDLHGAGDATHGAFVAAKMRLDTDYPGGPIRGQDDDYGDNPVR